MKIFREFLSVTLAISTVFGGVAVASSAHASQPMSGEYIVPVDDEKLAPLARFPLRLNDQNYQVESGRLTFPLPEALVGAPTSITMVKKGDGTWAGKNVDGVCVNEESTFKCDVKFKGLKFNPAAVAALALRDFGNSPDAMKRIEVATRFSTEPLGVLIYEFKPEK